MDLTSVSSFETDLIRERAVFTAPSYSLPNCSPKKEMLLKNLGWLIKFFQIVIMISFCLSNWPQSAACDAKATTTGHDAQAVLLVSQLPLKVNSATGQGLIIQASINGSKPLSFFVDTGFNQTVLIEEWAARLAHLSVPTNTEIVSSGRLRVSRIVLKDVTLIGTSPGLSLHCSPVPAFIGSTFSGAGLGTPRMAGVIGLPLLKGFVIQLDFAHRLLHVFDAKHRPQIRPGSVSLKLAAPVASNARYFVTWPSTETITVTTSLDSNGHPHDVTDTTRTTYDLLLDTGANDSWLPQEVIDDLHPLAMFADRRFSASGWQSITSLLVPSVGLGGLVASNLYLTSSKSQDENVLGLDILRQFLVTLDFPGGKIILEKFEAPAERGHVRGTTGILLRRTKESFIIDRVLNNTDAQKAGLQVGNKVIRVDSQPLAELSQNIAQRLLNGNTGTDAHLAIEDGQGRLKNVMLHRISQTEPKLYLIIGVQLGQDEPDEKVRITSILCSSAAWAAGLRAGDEVLRVNGIAIKSFMQAENQLRVWPKVKIKLIIQEQGQKRIILVKAPSLKHRDNR